MKDFYIIKSTYHYFEKKSRIKKVKKRIKKGQNILKPEIDFGIFLLNEFTAFF